MEYSVKDLSFEGSRTLRLSSDDNYGILLTSRGSGVIQSSGENSCIGPEEMMICRPGCVCSLCCPGNENRGFYWFTIAPQLLDRLSGEKTDVRKGFDSYAYKIAVIRPVTNAMVLMKSLIRQLVVIDKDRDDYCMDLLEESTLKMFIALVLKSCVSKEKGEGVSGSSGFSMDELFEFIKQHLAEDLTLERLEKEFYVSRSFLTKKFKEATGQTVHSYIVKMRLDLCRQLLHAGYSAMEIYCMAGFCSYNHFFRAFKKEYGMTPGEYLKLDSSQEKNKEIRKLL